MLQQMKNSHPKAGGNSLGNYFRTESEKLEENMRLFATRIGIDETLKMDTLLPYMMVYSDMKDEIMAILGASIH